MINKNEAISLLKEIISIPSVSKNEKEVSDYLFNYLKQSDYNITRKYYNICCKYKHFDSSRKSILLNSHIDTVKPTNSWTKNPYSPVVEGNKLFGLGSNDAGASLVSLISVFKYFQNKDIPFNIILLLSAEEEITGVNGVEAIIPDLPKIDFAIVGEPTEMKMAVAEKGLLVIDGYAKGVSGHVAHDNTKNAIYKAIENVNIAKKIKFDKQSGFLGDVKLNVTQINAGSNHNVIPDECRFVMDVRINEKYTLKEVFEIISENLNCETKARSFRLNSSSIELNHEFVKAAKNLGLELFGSNTTSDQTRMHFSSVKIGPGDTKRSHTADEFIYTDEISSGITKYIELLETYFKTYETLE